jgi:site-specific recombinase XerD
MTRKNNGSCSVSAPAQRGTHIGVPREADPNHHLWRNGRLWWIAFTVHRGHRQERIRFSLGTADVEEARRQRDAILDIFASADDCEVSLRFPLRRKEPASLPTELYEKAEVERLIGACSKRAPTGVRNRALLAFLFSSGLRLGEALALRPHDVDLDRGIVHVRRGKGGKSRRSGLFRFAEPHLAAWIAAREKLDGAHDLAPLFCKLDGGKIDQSYVRHLLPRLARKAGLQVRVHAHGFRHSHAAELDKAGVRLKHISEQLGHARPSTTDTYLSRIGSAGLVEAIQEVA